MLVWERHRELRHFTDGVEYSFLHSEIRCRVPNPACRGLLWIKIAHETTIFHDHIIACLGCDGREEECYYKLHKQQFMTSLRSCYPDIPDVFADKVAETFMAILMIGNATHRCPQCDPVRTSIFHDVIIEIQPRSSRQAEEEAEEEIIIRQEEMGDEEEEEGYDEEEFWPLPSPATRSSVEGLLKADLVAEEEEANCGICLEKMERSMRMPCSHRYHRGCLLEWLNNNHSCPLCRYQLPAVCQT